MKTVLILHGIGGYAGIHWQRWLHDSLQSQGCKVLMPDLPNPNRPNRRIWLAEAKSQIKDVSTEELIIIGHSLGITTALDIIENLKDRIDGLVSVAGFSKPYGAELNEYFLVEKRIDFDSVTNNLRWAEVFYGDDDPYVTQSELRSLASALNVEPHVIPQGGHLNTEAGFTEFPELLEVVEAHL